MPSGALVNWLLEFFRSRISSDINLRFSASACQWLITCENSAGVISLPFVPDLYRLGFNPQLPSTCLTFVPDLVVPKESSLPAPGLAKAPKQIIIRSGLELFFEYDIPGLVYWMLARCEEVSTPAGLLDNHQRFPSIASHAFRHGYLDRPIVDEWILVLRQIVNSLWPRLSLVQTQFQILVSHDVDAPSAYGFGSKAEVLRSNLSRLLRLGELGRPLQALQIRRATRQQLHPADPFNTFDWLMDCSEQAGLRSAFYFICGRTNPRRDALYHPEHPAIRALLRRIHARGHEIGLHPSYDSWDDPAVIAAEAARLRSVAASEGIQQPVWGGRMHYLRWRWPTTALGWELAGFAYDSSLGYADRPGFRCGTCHPYRMFDPVAQRRLNLIQRPLIVMEASVIDSHQLGLGYGPAALALFERLQQRCLAVSGQFTLLWHNSHLTRSADRRLYQHLLSPARPTACPA